MYRSTVANRPPGLSSVTNSTAARAKLDWHQRCKAPVRIRSIISMQSKIKNADPDKKYRRVLAASTLAGDSVRNSAGEDLGKVDEIMIDIPSGRVGYAVLSFGGVLGMGNKLFAVPWSALRVDEDEKFFILDVDKTKLEKAPGFDKSNWPNMADTTWGSEVFRYYGATPYWEEKNRNQGYQGRRTKPWRARARRRRCLLNGESFAPGARDGSKARRAFRHARL